jgi:uncharacterized protein (TIGR03032 family)
MSAPITNPTNPTAKKSLRCRASGNFAEWLANSGGSVAVTTYTSGKLVLIASRDNRLRFRTHHFTRPMGMAFEGRHLALAVRNNILLFQTSTTTESPDTRFKLKRQYATGRLDSHDVAFGRRGIYFANTRCNCIARATTRFNFLRNWQPPFITDMVHQDRCHLNGLGMHRGRPAMATAFCETGHAGGWRDDNRFDSGVLIDVRENQVVARGLCMPHSPRRHEGHWWLCNSGHGTLCRFDPTLEQCESVCSLPGFTRGLCFAGDHALVGLSKIRDKHVLDAPSIAGQPAKSRSGVALVDLTTGNQTGMLEFVSGGREVYEVVFLPGIRWPELNGIADA